MGAGGFEPARPFVRTVGAQQLFSSQCTWIVQSFRDGGGAERRQGRFHDWVGVNSVPCAVAEPDGEIQSFACKVHAIVGGHDPKVDMRVGRSEERRGGKECFSTCRSRGTASS